MSTLEINTKNSAIKLLSVFILWLFQGSAIIGISLGYHDWFIGKTPLNLMIMATLLILNFPIHHKKTIVLALLFFAVSFILEWVGVHYGFLFGEYSYGQNLGVKLDEVPLLIGINWTVLIFCTAAIADRLVSHPVSKIILGASFMVFLDFFIETSAPLFDFWSWELGYAPLRNYIAWFVISAALHFVYRQSKIKGDFNFSCHLYAAQLVFFGYFYVYHLWL
jgi:putative membrane protein